MFLYAVTYDCCKAHILMTVFLCLPMRVGINLIVSLFDLWWESSRDVHTRTIHWVLFVFTTVLTFIFWSYEPCRYFTAGKIVERWTLLLLTAGHVVFCKMYVSVDKLAAVPMLCVEQPVLPLFCMSASQSVIVSLWRSVPVWLCFCWIMTAYIGQDDSQYVMLLCDKNKVNGFFVFLFCCSFESYRLL